MRCNSDSALHLILLHFNTSHTPVACLHRKVGLTSIVHSTLNTSKYSLCDQPSTQTTSALYLKWPHLLPDDHATPPQASNNVAFRLAPLVLLPSHSDPTTQLTRRTQQLLTRRVRSAQPHEHVRGHQTTASSSSQQPCQRNPKFRRTSQTGQLLGTHAKLTAKR